MVSLFLKNRVTKISGFQSSLARLSTVTAKRNVVLHIYCLMRFIIYNVLFVFHKVQIFDCEPTTVWKVGFTPCVTTISH